MAKATKETIRQRLADVLCWRLEGAQLWDIRKNVQENEKTEGSHWFLPEGETSLSDDQLRRYMRAVESQIEESCRGEREELVRRHIAQRRALFARTLRAERFQVALNVLDSEAKLLGLFPCPEDEVRREMAEIRALVEAGTEEPADEPGGTETGSGATEGGSDPAPADPPSG